MTATPTAGRDEYVLVLMPTAKDGERTRQALARAGLAGVVCADMAELCQEIAAGAGVALLTEEAVASDRSGCLVDVLRSQPAWSDLPLVVLARAGAAGRPAPLDASMNVSLVERPIRVRSLLSVVEAALRSRRHQYVIRGHLAERERQAKSLRESEARARRLLEFHQAVTANMGEGLYAVDTLGLVTYLNPAAEALFGWTSAELQGRKMHDVTHYKHLDGTPFPAEECAGLRVLREGKALRDYEDMFIRKDGTFFPVIYSSAPLVTEGRTIGLVVVFRDISERKRVEQGLRFLAEASATLASLVDYESTLQKVAALAVPYFADWCAVDMAEPGGLLRRVAVAHVDPAKVRLAQELEQRYPPGPEASYRAYHVLRTGMPEMLAEIPDAVLTEAARDAEHLRILRELGLKSYMSVPLQVRGKTLGVVSFVAAESGRRYTSGDLAFAEELARRAAIAIENAQLYAELREVDRLKDEFLAMLAHELRNPLAPIRNALHIMKLSAANGAIVRQSRDMAERQVQHMARLLDDLLDVSRISRGKIELRKELLDLAAVVHRTVEAVRPLLEERDHEFSLSLPSEPLQVEGDPTRLEQILTNLLNNAAKYTDPGGQIELTAGREGTEVVLRVRDTGIGIAPDMLSRIFDLFIQAERRLDRSQGGVGIGLTLVRKLVELHGGSVAAHSAGLGQGSEFVVRLPSMAPEPWGGQVEQRGGGRAAAPLTPRKILVVDDNVDAADSTAMLLRLAGQEVRVAYDGPTALLIAQAFRPHMVLLDIGMPGMDGYEVAGRLRADSQLRPVLLVAMTGWGQEEDRRRSLQAGFDHHLLKPTEPEALHRLLAGLNTP